MTILFPNCSCCPGSSSSSSSSSTGCVDCSLTTSTMMVTFGAGQTFSGFTTLTLTKDPTDPIWTAGDFNWFASVHCGEFGWVVVLQTISLLTGCTWSITMNGCVHLYDGSPTFSNGVHFVIGVLEIGSCSPTYYDDVSISW